MPVATHEISLRGISGAMFWLMLSALVFYVLGFSTVGWEKFSGLWIGLWLSCRAGDHTYYNSQDEGIPFIPSMLYIFSSKRAYFSKILYLRKKTGFNLRGR